MQCKVMNLGGLECSVRLALGTPQYNYTKQSLGERAVIFQYSGTTLKSGCNNKAVVQTG